MWRVLLALFLIVPVVELVLLIWLAHATGWLAALALIVVTGLAGAALARQQGLAVLFQVQRDLAEGKVPGEALLDGAFVLVGAALLVTPGVLTDVLGLMLLLPATRIPLRRWVQQRVERMLRQRQGVIDVEWTIISHGE